MSVENIKQFFKKHGKTLAAIGGGILGGLALGNGLYDRGWVDGYSTKQHEVDKIADQYSQRYPWGTGLNNDVK